MISGIGARFQNETKYSRGKLQGGSLDFRKKPEPWKSYPGVPTIGLEPPLKEGGKPLWESIRHRRSIRRFKNIPLSRPELSQLLWASQGTTGRVGDFKLRAAPSAGALYPLETYVFLRSAEGIDAGIYHYSVRGHALELLLSGDHSLDVARAGLDQDFLAEAAAVFAWTAVFARSRWKYRERAYRYVYLDAGHVAQNLALAGVALDLGSCPVAALYDQEVNELLGVEGEEESILYMTAVGRPG
jgi:SagB-type dehydrogenase family enzyme